MLRYGRPVEATGASTARVTRVLVHQAERAYRQGYTLQAHDLIGQAFCVLAAFDRANDRRARRLSRRAAQLASSH